LDDWYEFFFARDNFESHRIPGQAETYFKLDKMRELCRLAGEPARAARFIHIAGTNGKGSTCFFLEQGLLAAFEKSARIGLFMSPHVESACERIRIDGQSVSEVEMRWAAEKIAEYIPPELNATCFEALLLAALLLFEKHACGWIILETGIGGRLDATNIFTPELCILTPIALDHVPLLGTSLPEIAREKAGIIKPGVPVLCARQDPAAREVIQARCLELGAPHYEIAGYTARELGFAGTLLTRDDGTAWQTKMPGMEQAANLELALAALSLLHAGSGHKESALADPPAPNRFRARLLAESLPARLEYCAGEPAYLIDGAHNPAALANLAGFIARRREEGRIQNCAVITAMMADKDIAANMRIIGSFADTLIITTLPLERAAGIAELERHIRAEVRYTRARTPPEALAYAREEAAKNNALIVIAGSFVLTGVLRGQI
jgi:dihydrofolate synthase/folylpolyglutamate synthase